MKQLKRAIIFGTGLTLFSLESCIQKAESICTEVKESYNYQCIEIKSKLMDWGCYIKARERFLVKKIEEWNPKDSNHTFFSDYSIEELEDDFDYLSSKRLHEIGCDDSDFHALIEAELAQGEEGDIFKVIEYAEDRADFLQRSNISEEIYLEDKEGKLFLVYSREGALQWLRFGIELCTNLIDLRGNKNGEFPWEYCEKRSDLFQKFEVYNSGRFDID